MTDCTCINHCCSSLAGHELCGTVLPCEEVSKVVSDVEKFLSPLINGSPHRSADRTLIDALILSVPTNTKAPSAISDEDRRVMLAHTGDYLMRLDIAVHAHTQDKSQNPIDTSLVVMISCLLDLLYIEGVYPGLALGICVLEERKAVSLFYTNGKPDSAGPRNLGFAPRIVLTLLPSFFSSDNSGIKRYIQGRNLHDMIASAGDLAFTASRSQVMAETAKEAFKALVDNIPVGLLYPIMSSLVKSKTAPACFKEGMAAELSILACRKNGVQRCIEFISASHAEAASDQPPVMMLKDVKVSMEALQAISRLLSSMPKGVTPVHWLDRISGQLVHLLDGAAGEELAQIAGFVIGHGILSKKELGGPESNGWLAFIVPIHEALEPNPFISETLLTPHATLNKMLCRMHLILYINPHSGLVSRIIRPVLLSLWALANYEHKPEGNYTIEDVAFNLITLYLRRTGGLKSVQIIASKMMFNGAAEWSYGPDPTNKAVSIIMRSELQDSRDAMQLLGHISLRITNYIRLLSASDVDKQTLNALFLQVMQQWLSMTTSSLNATLQAEKTSNPIDHLIVAKLAQIMLEHFQDQIASDPTNILELILQLLKQRVQQHKDEKAHAEASRRPNLDNLSRIVQKDAKTVDQITDELSGVKLSEPDDMIEISLSLIRILALNPDLKRDQQVQNTLNTVTSTLQSLKSFYPFNSPVAQNMHETLKQVMQADKLCRDKNAGLSHTPTAWTDRFQIIQQEVTSEHIPERIFALQKLGVMIEDKKMMVDIYAAALLLLHTIRTDPQDMIYLAGINFLVALAAKRNVRIVADLTIIAFIDAGEETNIDGRIRLCQALSQLAEMFEHQRYHENYWSFRELVVDSMASPLLFVARGGNKRERERDEELKHNQLDDARHRQALAAWDGEIPDLPSYLTDDDGQEMTDVRMRTRALELEHFAKIVNGWKSKGGEDIRIRASAVSVLADILRVSLDVLDPAKADQVVYVALAILMYEKGSGNIILRRAAAYLLATAMDAIINLPDIIPDGLVPRHKFAYKGSTYLRFVLDLTKLEDPDELVRGHASVASRKVGEWLTLRGMMLKDSAGGVERALRPDMGLDGKLKGLDIAPVPASKCAPKKPLIEVVEL